MQVLRFGFFHADPHPGNVAVDKGDAEGKGRLVIYDYGMMGRIDPKVRSGFLDLFYAVFEKNSDSAVKALGKMGVLVRRRRHDRREAHRGLLPRLVRQPRGGAAEAEDREQGGVRG